MWVLENVQEKKTDTLGTESFQTVGISVKIPEPLNPHRTSGPMGVSWDCPVAGMLVPS